MMIQQGFYLKKNIPRPWWVSVYSNIETETDLDKVYGALLETGTGWDKADEALKKLKGIGSFVYSNTKEHKSIIVSTGIIQDSDILSLTEQICNTFSIPIIESTFLQRFRRFWCRVLRFWL